MRPFLGSMGDSSYVAGKDSFGLNVTGPHGALAGINWYHICLITYQRWELWSEILVTAKAFPTSVMTNLLAADFSQQQFGGLGPGGDKFLAAAEALAGWPSTMSEREKGYLRALRTSAANDLRGAYKAWLAVVESFPTDLFAVKRGQFLALMVEDTDGILEIARAATLGDSHLGRYYGGMLTFGLQQTGDLPGAELEALKALRVEAAAKSAQPDIFEDGWLHHSLALVYHAQGKLDDGLTFLTAHCSQWRREALHPYLFTHLWWHLVLLHVESGNAEAALVLFDEQLWAGADEFDMEVQINAIDILLRLHLRGVPDLTKRWETVLDAIDRAPRMPTALPPYPLFYLLKLSALCVAGRPVALTLLEDIRKEAARTPIVAKMHLPLAESLVILLATEKMGADEQQCTEARKCIMTLKGQQNWKQVMGNEQQRSFLLEVATLSPGTMTPETLAALRAKDKGLGRMCGLEAVNATNGCATM